MPVGAGWEFFFRCKFYLGGFRCEVQIELLAPPQESQQIINFASRSVIKNVMCLGAAFSETSDSRYDPIRNPFY